MTVLHSIILGLVEGITEFLPISSTGHLILVSSLLKLQSTDFLKSFEIIIQLGSILAVVVLYWRSFFSVEIIKRLIVGFLPTAVIGLALYSIVKKYLLGNEHVVLWALAVGGVLLIILELIHKERFDATKEIEHITYGQAFSIGLFQSIAIIPGVSRSAATIVGGLLLGIRRATIVEFSFLLAVPTMAAATALDILKSYNTFSLSDAAPLTIGFVVAFVAALLSIQFLLGYVRNNSFIPFGVYRIALALLFFFLILK